MCFPNKRENACMFPIKPPKKLGNAHMFCIPRGPMVGNAHVLFLCFFVFPKNEKIQSFILRRAQADWQQSGPANLSKRKRKKKMPHSALKIVATPAWWSKNEETIVCLLWLARFALAECKKYVSPKKSPKRWIGANLEKNAGKKLWKL